MATNKELETMIAESASMLDEAFSDVAYNLAKAMAEQEMLYVNPLLSKKLLQETYRQEITQELEKTKQRIRTGPLVFLEALDTHEQEITECFTKLSSLARTISSNRAVFMELLQQDKTPQEMAEISDDLIEVLYQFVKAIFEQERYVESRDAFGFLCIVNSQLYPFWIGLANSQYQLAEYEDALFAYDYAAELASDDHVCHLLASRCYVALNSLENAIKSLEKASSILAHTQQEKHLLEQVELEIKQLVVALQHKGKV